MAGSLNAQVLDRLASAHGTTLLPMASRMDQAGHRLGPQPPANRPFLVPDRLQRARGHLGDETQDVRAAERPETVLAVMDGSNGNAKREQAEKTVRAGARCNAAQALQPSDGADVLRLDQAFHSLPPHAFTTVFGGGSLTSDSGVFEPG